MFEGNFSKGDVSEAVFAPVEALQVEMIKQNGILIDVDCNRLHTISIQALETLHFQILHVWILMRFVTHSRSQLGLGCTH